MISEQITVMTALGPGEKRRQYLRDVYQSIIDAAQYSNIEVDWIISHGISTTTQKIIDTIRRPVDLHLNIDDHVTTGGRSTDAHNPVRIILIQQPFDVPAAVHRNSCAFSAQNGWLVNLDSRRFVG